MYGGIGHRPGIELALAAEVGIEGPRVRPAARMAHSWIHLGSNDILQRKNAFLTSYILLFFSLDQTVYITVTGLKICGLMALMLQKRLT